MASNLVGLLHAHTGNSEHSAGADIVSQNIILSQTMASITQSVAVVPTIGPPEWDSEFLKS